MTGHAIAAAGAWWCYVPPFFGHTCRISLTPSGNRISAGAGCAAPTTSTTPPQNQHRARTSTPRAGRRGTRDVRKNAFSRTCRQTGPEPRLRAPLDNARRRTLHACPRTFARCSATRLGAHLPRSARELPRYAATARAFYRTLSRRRTHATPLAATRAFNLNLRRLYLYAARICDMPFRLTWFFYGAHCCPRRDTCACPARAHFACGGTCGRPRTRTWRARYQQRDNWLTTSGPP